MKWFNSVAVCETIQIDLDSFYGRYDEYSIQFISSLDLLGFKYFIIYNYHIFQVLVLKNKNK